MNFFAFEQSVIEDRILHIKTGKILDNSNAHEMVETLRQAHIAGRHNVVLNMYDLEFLSSAGVGSILSSVDLFRQSGGDIVLCGMSPTILHVFQVLDVADFLTITTSEADAMARYARH